MPDGKVGIFGTDALADFLEAAVEFDVHVALIILRQILRTVVLDRHIGVPLDVIYFRIRGHQVVYHTENEVLHGRIGKVKHYLRAPRPNTTSRSEALSTQSGCFS